MKATWKDFEASDYLGGCSYKSKQDFIDCNDYYQDMKARAFDELCEKILKAKDDIKTLE